MALVGLKSILKSWARRAKRYSINCRSSYNILKVLLQEKSSDERSDAGSQAVESDYDVDEEYDNDYADNYFDNGEGDDLDDIGGGDDGGGGMAISVMLMIRLLTTITLLRRLRLKTRKSTHFS